MAFKTWEDRAIMAEAERDDLKIENARLRSALRKIADMDYRGNRSAESSIAFRALEIKSVT